MVSLKTGQPVHDVVMGVFHPDEEIGGLPVKCCQF